MSWVSVSIGMLLARMRIKWGCVGDGGSDLSLAVRKSFQEPGLIGTPLVILDHLTFHKSRQRVGDILASETDTAHPILSKNLSRGEAILVSSSNGHLVGVHVSESTRRQLI